MSIPSLFVRRPVMTVLVMMGILVFGAISYSMLPVSSLPNVDFPTIEVTANLPGASPETMAAAVATPLEKQFSAIPAIDSMTSISATGVSRITLQFALDRNIDAAAQDVQSAISLAQKQLPPTMTTPPSFRKVNPAAASIFYLTLTSDTMPLSQVDEYAETLMAQRISMVSGVAQVDVFGSQPYAVRIQLDPRALASRGIGIDQVATAIDDHNSNLPTGTLYSHDRAYTVSAEGQLKDAAAYRPMVVAYRNGAPVRLDQLGRVIDGVQNDKVAAWFDGKRAVILGIKRQPGTNTIEVVDSIRKLLPTFRAEIPPGVKVGILYDRSQSIRSSVREVEFTLLLALVLVVLVIFVFLRNLSATVIPSLALPLSIVGTFSVLYMFHYSIDNLSLLALTLCVGFVVDDAIVMLENISRHMEMGKKRLQATFDGSKEIGFTIVTMTMSLLAVFIPVLFMGGILGRLLHEFAVTIMTAVLLSGFVSLSLTPMLCSRILQPHTSRHGRLYMLSERGFDALRNGYDRSLQWVLRHERLAMMTFLVIIVATAYLFYVVPKGFLPEEDTGQLFVFTEAAQDIGFDRMAQLQQEAAAIVRKDPNIAQMISFIGISGSSQQLNLGRMFITLKSRDERIGANEVIQELRPKLAKLPGMKVFLQNVPIIRIGGHLTKSEYQYTLQDADIHNLMHWAPIIEDKMKTLRGLQDVTSDLQIANLQVQVDILRDKASALGVTPAQIENALYDAYGSRQVSTIYTPSNEYWVIMELEPKYQADPAALSMLYVSSSNGNLVPLSAVTRISRGVGPLTINHLGQLPAVTISFNLAPGVALSQAIDEVDSMMRQISPPGTLTGSFQGSAQAFQASLANMGFLLVMAVLVIYIVLGILYESFIHPFTILSGLPTAGLGALITLLLFHATLDMYAFVGIIMLIGIVKKNAIIMIDFAIEAVNKDGMSPRDAMYNACIIRFRPI
ncbi:MAG TPA: efflux RND transporter permease subunit, partial [Burkholderiales bacterium]|nr:efflux RND transporter permease subunit [Burkholderiales bacterium]